MEIIRIETFQEKLVLKNKHSTGKMTVFKNILEIVNTISPLKNSTQLLTTSRYMTKSVKISRTNMKKYF